MRLSDLLKPTNVVVPLAASDKAAAITELVATLARHNEIADEQEVLQGVFDREATRSTGIGSGLAIPHAKTKGTERISLAIGKADVPIDFDSADKKGVTLICLLASPPQKTSAHIQTLSAVSRLFANDEFRARANAATSAQALYDLIVKQEDAAA